MRDSNKLSCSEAGKLGFIASRKVAEEQKAKRRLEYYAAPTLCHLCKTPIPYEKKHHKFCSQSCNAIVSNFNRYKKDTSEFFPTKEIKSQRFCLHCNKATKNKYCSLQCQQDYYWILRKQKLIIDGYDTVMDCKNAKRYLIETNGNACDICKGTEWYGNPMPLTLDHINGNSEDNSLINLRVICPNCDRFTPFFGSKNRGNGRASRRQRYQDGKSY